MFFMKACASKKKADNSLIIILGARARIEADTMEDLKDVISLKVRRIYGIRSTITMTIM
jgi:hypothetical protein